MDENKYFICTLETKDSNIEVNVQLPKACPYCNVIVHPHLLWHTPIEEWILHSAREGKSPNISAVYDCLNCEKEFMYSYKLFFYLYELQSEIIKHHVDINYLLKEIPEEIAQVSENFCKIYHQSLLAEKNDLNLISGVGFRKSVEFLVKDYIINMLKSTKEEISKKPLSQAINMIDNTKIKATALAATWLGNDETHYEKKYTDKDISDMKRFIKALTHHIASEFHANEAIEFIGHNKH